MGLSSTNIQSAKNNCTLLHTDNRNRCNKLEIQAIPVLCSSSSVLSSSPNSWRRRSDKLMVLVTSSCFSLRLKMGDKRSEEPVIMRYQFILFFWSDALAFFAAVSKKFGHTLEFGRICYLHYEKVQGHADLKKKI